MIWGAVVVAAGRGTRFGRPKQLLELAGKPMLAWSIETLAAIPEIRSMVVTSESATLSATERLVRTLAPNVDASAILGGAERQDSVRLGIEALVAEGACDAILVHDGARPLILADDVRRGMAAVRKGVAALLGIPVVDTVKVLDAERRVVRTLDRSVLWSAQTPQFAMADELCRAHRQAHASGLQGTDDAMLLEAAGVEVVVVEGNPENFKVTVPGDLTRAELILRERLALGSAVRTAT